MSDHEIIIADALCHQIKRMNKEENMTDNEREAILNEFGYYKWTPQKGLEQIKERVDEAYNDLINHTGSKEERQEKQRWPNKWLDMKASCEALCDRENII